MPFVQRNLITIYDAIGTLADAVGDELNQRPFPLFGVLCIHMAQVDTIPSTIIHKNGLYQTQTLALAQWAFLSVQFKCGKGLFFISREMDILKSRRYKLLVQFSTNQGMNK
ncbi:hypothetical protein L1987_03429 [Smallanthus sonchifolius]|uniref:Uncharacterized protein n=1 Tax=Smallanthus sonchifolius TaxID=185202 RepID=A0ACB9KAP0_9ASTR|nr:hypothetical protein L1987_03429 [Smallanthus sonchifolius]